MKETLNEELADVRRAIKEKSGVNKAVAELAQTIRKPKKGASAEALMVPADYKTVDAAVKRLEMSARRQQQLWNVQRILAERQESGEKLTYQASDVPSSLRDVKLTPGQITQYAAHPRLDLFVDGNSAH